MINEGFGQNKSKNEKIPPGQYLEKSFPILSAGPTVHINKESWDFTIFENDTILNFTFKSTGLNLIQNFYAGIRIPSLIMWIKFHCTISFIKNF